METKYCLYKINKRKKVKPTLIRRNVSKKIIDSAIKNSSDYKITKFRSCSDDDYKCINEMNKLRKRLNIPNDVLAYELGYSKSAIVHTFSWHVITPEMLEIFKRYIIDKENTK